MIETNSNVEKLSLHLKELRGKIAYARRRGLFELSDAYRAGMHDEILSQGHGSWPGLHPFTMRYKLPFRVGERSEFFQRKGKYIAFGWLASLARYSISKNQRFSRISFGHGNQINSALQKIAGFVESGSGTRVSDKMRRLFAAGGFPLRKQTKFLILKPRPFIDSVFSRVDQGIFARKFEEKINF